jgi:hypothetical protein
MNVRYNETNYYVLDGNSMFISNDTTYCPVKFFTVIMSDDDELNALYPTISESENMFIADDQTV